MSITDDKFTVFISHKHEDHALAVEVKNAMEGLSPELIDCFVSGVDITGGHGLAARDPERPRQEPRSSCCCSPRRRRTGTGASTRPACTPASTGPRSVLGRLPVQPRGASPSPLADLQGVPADADKVRDFPGHVVPADVEDVRRLAPRAAGARDRGRPGGGRGARHRRGVPPFGVGLDVLPLPSRGTVVVRVRRYRERDPRERAGDGGPNDTSGYTMSLFDLAGGTGKADVGRSVASRRRDRGAWRRELDSHFLQALDEQLFPPIEGRMRAGGTSRGEKRLYRPILYSIVRGPAVGPCRMMLPRATGGPAR